MHHFFPQENLHTSLASPILFAHHATNQARSRVSMPFEVCRKCPEEYQHSFLDLEVFWVRTVRPPDTRPQAAWTS